MLIYLDIYKNIKFKSSRLQIYDYSASGNAICANNSIYDVPNVQYVITYYDNRGNFIMQDDGYVTYGVLKAGESEVVYIYTSYVGSASKFNIRVKFDEESLKAAIMDYIVNKEYYTGKEYDEFIAKYDSEEQNDPLFMIPKDSLMVE